MGVTATRLVGARTEEQGFRLVCVLCVWCLQSELVSELAEKEESVSSLKRQLTETQAHAEVGVHFLCWGIACAFRDVHGLG